ncbi:sulfur carrier protein ThiS [Gracilibacillus kekensis]|uniref:Sulfur carrier protein n=1 Tax=Gracilibacillus kekensis TaxID=1027249 RepID=A0A1M7J220_9BACI|nr:sulfur carrier protein ThiS [Gracilibacillus kekensis]SHM46963.1 sulfur carrier protein [Gracilibacillus kekensis]
MGIIVNGESLELNQRIETVEDLLGHLQLKKKSLIVEHNQTILKMEQHDKAKVTEGDRFEIVHFVGGG